MSIDDDCDCTHTDLTGLRISRAEDVERDLDRLFPLSLKERWKRRRERRQRERRFYLSEDRSIEDGVEDVNGRLCGQISEWEKRERRERRYYRIVDGIYNHMPVVYNLLHNTGFLPNYLPPNKRDFYKENGSL